MQAEAGIHVQIRAFMMQTFPALKKRPISDDSPLLDSGIVDSLGTLDVVTFLEKSFGITVLDDDLTPDNFATIRALTAFVQKKTDPVKVPTE